MQYSFNLHVESLILALLFSLCRCGRGNLEEVKVLHALWDARGSENEREVLIGWCTSVKVELFQIIPFFICPFWKLCVSAPPEKISYDSFELIGK